MEKELPKRAIPRILSALPRFNMSNMEARLPRRTFDRTEIVLPSWAKLKIDTLAFPTAFPSTDAAEPMRA
jgi:hypothetical protein